MKNLRRLLLLPLLLLAAAVGAGPTHEFRLDNGLAVIVREDHRAPVATVQVWYRVGASHEPDGLTGISHVLEHMMFKGTPNYGPGEYSRILSANGAEENAFTSRDYTGYYATLANDRVELADAMREALDMPNDEQLRRNQIMQERLRRYDVHRWARDFLTELEGMRDVQQRYYAKVIPPAALEKLRLAYHDAHSRLLLLDYDGTLVPFARRPQQARPGQALITLLSRLAAHPGTDLVIISGRQRDVLDAWFGELPIGLVAEHGFWIREAGHEWSEVQHRTSLWKSELHPILQLYADRLPGAFVEEKEHSLVRHCRAADPEQARVIESELADHIMTFTANIDVQVLRGAKVVEIRNAGVNKGIAARRWMMNAAYDFVFAAGDDWTDEDLFAAGEGHTAHQFLLSKKTE